MDYVGFPSNPAQRRALVVVDTFDFTRSMLNGDTNGLYNNQTHLIQFPLDERIKNRVVERLSEKDLLRPGLILVQSAYSDDIRPRIMMTPGQPF